MEEESTKMRQYISWLCANEYYANENPVWTDIVHKLYALYSDTNR